MNVNLTSRPVYRIDRFQVPQHARAEFLNRVRSTHRTLRTLPGFIDDVVIEEPGATDLARVMTIVIWNDQEALESARAAVTQLHREQSFDAQKFRTRLQIQAELGTYVPIDMRES